MTERQRVADGPADQPEPELEPRWLGPALRALRLRTGRSLNAVARQVGIDPAYLHRIEIPPPPGTPGRVTVPRRALLLAIGRVLDLDPLSLDDLLVRAGYAPEAVLALGGWDATLGRVATLLAAPDLSPAAKAEFREVLAILASRWSSTPADPSA